MTLTYKELDKYESAYEKMEIEPFWPNPNQLRIMENAPDKYVLFANFLYEKNPAPRNQAEKYSKKGLQEFIYQHLQLSD